MWKRMGFYGPLSDWCWLLIIDDFILGSLLFFNGNYVCYECNYIYLLHSLIGNMVCGFGFCICHKFQRLHSNWVTDWLTAWYSPPLFTNKTHKTTFAIFESSTEFHIWIVSKHFPKWHTHDSLRLSVFWSDLWISKLSFSISVEHLICSHQSTSTSIVDGRYHESHMQICGQFSYKFGETWTNYFFLLEGTFAIFEWFLSGVPYIVRVGIFGKIMW